MSGGRVRCLAPRVESLALTDTRVYPSVRGFAIHETITERTLLNSIAAYDVDVGAAL